MDEEQIQQAQLRNQSSADSVSTTGGGTAGLPAPPYSNVGQYLRPSPTTGSNQSPPASALAVSAYPINMGTYSNSIYETPPVQVSEQISAAAQPGSAAAVASNADAVAGSNNGSLGRAIFESTTNVLGNNLVGEGISALGDAHSVVTGAARNYTPNSVNRNLAEVARPGSTATNLAEAQASRQATNAVRAEEALERVPGLARASRTARNVSRFMPVVGLYTDSTGLYEAATGTGEAANQSRQERVISGVTNGAGLTSSVIGTGALAGEGLTALGGTSMIGAETMGTMGAGLTTAFGEGSVAAGVGLGAGSAAAVLAAGAAGYGLGTYINEETGASELIAEGAYNALNEQPEYTENRGTTGARYGILADGTRVRINRNRRRR